jgi:hypothetical protein
MSVDPLKNYRPQSAQGDYRTLMTTMKSLSKSRKTPKIPLHGTRISLDIGFTSIEQKMSQQD